jgi:3-hydroxyisobutyrate dehydrogenase-like beta-hydroxyacid dehydrogenase
MIETTIGVLGAGLMGSAFVRRLLAMGRRVAVWNRTSARCAPLEAAGAWCAATPRELIAACDMVIPLTARVAEVETLLHEAAAELAGRDLVNLVTATPAQARSLDRLAQAHGAAFLSGTIQCYPSNIGDAEALILFGGDPEVWSRRETVLRELAGAATYVGADPGRPNVVDSGVTGAFIFTATAAALEAASYAAKDGLGPEEFREFIEIALRALPGEVRRALDAAEAGNFGTTDATLDIYDRALEMFRAAFADIGASDRLLLATHERVKAAVAAGDGGQGFPTLYRY